MFIARRSDVPVPTKKLNGDKNFCSFVILPISGGSVPSRKLNPILNLCKRCEKGTVSRQFSLDRASLESKFLRCERRSKSPD